MLGPSYEFSNVLKKMHFSGKAAGNQSVPLVVEEVNGKDLDIAMEPGLSL
jgi:hypothetical protein